jgi:hypothetical protein
VPTTVSTYGLLIVFPNLAFRIHFGKAACTCTRTQTDRPLRWQSLHIGEISMISEWFCRDRVAIRSFYIRVSTDPLKGANLPVRTAAMNAPLCGLQGADALFPFAWDQYVAHIPEPERADLLGAYYRRLTSDVRQTAEAAVRFEAAKTCFRRHVQVHLVFPSVLNFDSV